MSIDRSGGSAPTSQEDSIVNTHNCKSAFRNACIALTTATLIGTALAENATPADKTPESLNCLRIVEISNTRIIDDQNIVFRTRNNRFYNNHLPHKCGGLKSAGKFRYKTSLSELCNVDIITVMNGSGESMMDGASCGLGMFTPTEDPAKKPKKN